MLVVRYILLSFTVLIVSISSANAAVFGGFDGEVFNYQYYEGAPSDQADNGPKTVSSDVSLLPEVSNVFIGLGTMDIFNTGFEIDFDFLGYNGGTAGTAYEFDDSVLGINGFELTYLGSNIDFEALTWEITENFTDITLSDLIFGTNMIGIDWSGITVNEGDFIRMEVVNAVPVPAAIWLFGTALMGLVGFSRRKRSS
ncbi:MAG: VPLPA-CTERM sorting domain-containing protein [Gammaproteobacteria bacterium]